MANTILFQRPGFFILHPSPHHIAIFRDDCIIEPSASAADGPKLAPPPETPHYAVHTATEALAATSLDKSPPA
jgi:hypothetical protein